MSGTSSLQNTAFGASAPSRACCSKMALLSIRTARLKSTSLQCSTTLACLSASGARRSCTTGGRSTCARWLPFPPTPRRTRWQISASVKGQVQESQAACKAMRVPGHPGRFQGLEALGSARAGRERRRDHLTRRCLERGGVPSRLGSVVLRTQSLCQRRLSTRRWRTTQSMPEELRGGFLALSTLDWTQDAPGTALLVPRRLRHPTLRTLNPLLHLYRPRRTRRRVPLFALLCPQRRAPLAGRLRLQLAIAVLLRLRLRLLLILGYL
jgi:hypothetical protein